MYTLDATQARSADQRGSFINETGKYVGQFTRAEEIVSRSGTKGIGFTFKANDGRSSRFDVYTSKEDGSVLKIGTGLVMALMTCLSLRQIDAKPAMIKKWDGAAGREVDASAPCFLDLMGKPVGALLEREEFAKSDGGIGSRMVLVAVFQAGTELMASEILDRKNQPAQLGKVVATLKDRPLKGGKAAPARRTQGGGPDDGYGPGYADPDPTDDYPF